MLPCLTGIHAWEATTASKPSAPARRERLPCPRLRLRRYTSFEKCRINNGSCLYNDRSQRTFYRLVAIRVRASRHSGHVTFHSWE